MLKEQDFYIYEGQKLRPLSTRSPVAKNDPVSLENQLYLLYVIALFKRWSFYLQCMKYLSHESFWKNVFMKPVDHSPIGCQLPVFRIGCQLFFQFFLKSAT